MSPLGGEGDANPPGGLWMNDGQRRRIARSVVLILLLILFALLSLGARDLSFTFDEPSHLTAGYAFLARGASWTVPLRGHPLLVNAWEALPFFLGDRDIPVETLAGWGQDYLRYIEAFSPFMTRAMDRTEVAARTPGMLLTVLLGAVVYRWAIELGGTWTGLLALGILVFDPTLLAHGRLATNDVGVTALGTLGLFLLWRWTQSPTWLQATIVGLVMGLTTLTKGSGILWAAAGLSWATWVGLRRQRSHPTYWLGILFIGALSSVILWSMYGFSIGPVSRWPSLPLPAPQHWMGVLFQAEHADKPMMYALGEWRTTGWVWFFPFAFLIKNPLPLLIALLLSLGALINERRYLRKLNILGSFSAFYLALAIILGPNLGYRHMIPVHPLLYLLTAAGMARIWRRLSPISRWSIVALGVWYITGTMRVYPYNLAFFNEVVGGPANGWRYLEGSNTDWGQGWKALRTFRDEHSLTFSYSGPEGYARIAPYDLWDEPLPPLNFVSEPLLKPWLFPEPGDYVISANTLSGSFLVDPDNFAWFRYHAPEALIAKTLFHYHVESASAPAWLAQCIAPAAPLNDDAISEGFGEIPLRSVAFDCNQSWIYPHSGETRGVYALHGAILRSATLKERLCLTASSPVDAFAARHLKDVPLAFRQWENQALPAFALYEWQGFTLPIPLSAQVIAAPVDTPPAALTDDAFRTTLPLLNGPLTFLSVGVYSRGEVLEVETWWRVAEGPATRPLSIMAHLINEDGAVLGVADGLGVSPLTLEPGDVVVQRHRLPMPSKNTQLWLRTGAYWLDTMERWSVTSAPGSDALFVPLELKQ